MLSVSISHFVSQRRDAHMPLGCAVVTAPSHATFARQVILFTGKPDAPPVFRALAANLPHSFEFAYVVDSDKDIVEQFSVKRIPAMMIALIDPESKGVRLQPYPGPL